eukprot:222947_1
MKRLHCSSVGAQQEVQRDGGHPHHKGRRWRGNVTPKQMEGRVAQGDICSSHTEAGRGADPSLNCSATLLPPPAGELRQHGWSLRLTPELLQLFSSEEGKNMKLAVQIEAQSGKLFVGDKVYKLARLSSDMHMYSFGLVESQATTGGGGGGGFDGHSEIHKNNGHAEEPNVKLGDVGGTCYQLVEKSYATEKLMVKAERNLEFRRKMKERTQAAQAERSKNKIISIASQPVLSKPMSVKRNMSPVLPLSKPREVTTTQSKPSKESSESTTVVVSGISVEDDYIDHMKDMRFFFHPNKITDRGVMVIPKLSYAGLLEIDPSYNGKLYVRFQTPEECAQALKRNGESLKASGNGHIFTVKPVPLEEASVILKKALWLEAGHSIKKVLEAVQARLPPLHKLLANSMSSIVSSSSSRDVPPISIPTSEASYKELQSIRDEVQEMKYDLKRELSILDIPDEDECQKGGDLYNTNVVRPSALFKTMARRILEASLDDIRQRGSELNGALMVYKSRNGVHVASFHTHKK